MGGTGRVHVCYKSSEIGVGVLTLTMNGTIKITMAILRSSSLGIESACLPGVTGGRDLGQGGGGIRDLGQGGGGIRDLGQGGRGDYSG